VTPTRYQQVKSVFRLALEFPTSQRDEFLRGYCGPDRELLEEVMELLRCDAAPVSPVDRPAVGTQFRLRAVSLSYTATRHPS